MSRVRISPGWGPVFEADRTSRARRWQGYAVRMLFVLPFLLGFVLNWISRLDQFEPMTVAEAAQIGQGFMGGLTGVVLIGVLLIAPAATAGAVCLDKSRGMLAHLFVTDLSNREIILGKLAARLGPVWALLASTLPVAAVMTLLGGIDPMALTTLYLVAIGLAGLGCALGLMLSVWASKPHEVLTVVYGIWFVWLLSGPVYQSLYLVWAPKSPTWLEWTNPLYLVFAASQHSGAVSLVEPSLFCLACLGIGLICTWVAVARVRVVGCRSKGSAARRVGWIERGVEWSRGNARRFLVPKLDADPVLWREWHRNRPSRWSRVIWGAYTFISIGAGLGLAVTVISATRPERAGSVAAATLGLLTTIGLVLLSTSVASVLTEERARGSLDVLLCTPVSTRAILWAKWRGSFRRVPWLIFWPVAMGALCSSFHLVDGVQIAITVSVMILILAQGAALVSLGLALATWVKKPEQATTGTIAVMVFMLAGWPFVAKVALGLLIPLVILGCLSLAFVLARRRHSEPALLLAGAAVLLASLVAVKIVFFPNEAEYLPRDALVLIRNYGMMMGCPIVGISMPLMLSLVPRSPYLDDTEGMLVLVVGWVLVSSLAAWLLFEATVRTFDRSLGRTPAPVQTRWHAVTDWGSRTLARGGRPAGRGVSFEPPPR